MKTVKPAHYPCHIWESLKQLQTLINAEQSILQRYKSIVGTVPVSPFRYHCTSLHSPSSPPYDYQGTYPDGEYMLSAMSLKLPQFSIVTAQTLRSYKYWAEKPYKTEIPWNYAVSARTVNYKRILLQFTFSVTDQLIKNVRNRLQTTIQTNVTQKRLNLA